MVEYEGCLLGLQQEIDLDVQEMLIIVDSNLIIHHVWGEWATNNQKLLPYLECLHRLHKSFTKIEFKHVPKIQNDFSDALTTLSSIIEHSDRNHIDPIYIRIYEQPTYCFHVEEDPNRKPWYNDIQGYLKNDEYPKEASSV